MAKEILEIGGVGFGDGFFAVFRESKKPKTAAS